MARSPEPWDTLPGALPALYRRAPLSCRAGLRPARSPRRSVQRSHLVRTFLGVPGIPLCFVCFVSLTRLETLCHPFLARSQDGDVPFQRPQDLPWARR